MRLGSELLGLYLAGYNGDTNFHFSAALSLGTVLYRDSLVRF